MDARAALRDWYRPRRRMYPWRSARPDPYRVLVSEVMLQQTQAARVTTAFRPFLRRFPTVSALAAAPRREVLRAWSGLGYNRRAVNLSEAARQIVRDHGGRVPPAPGTLRTLPGVGPYTAAAVASIAFGMPVPALDTNVARVVARVSLGTEAHEVPRTRVHDAAAEWIDLEDPGSWNQPRGVHAHPAMRGLSAVPVVHVPHPGARGQTFPATPAAVRRIVPAGQGSVDPHAT